MIEEKKKDDHTLIKSRDPGLPSYTFFWMKEGKLISPYFGKENDAMKWKEKQERENK